MPDSGRDNGDSSEKIESLSEVFEDKGFDESYIGTPPWDIGRPQKEIIQLEEIGEIEGSVLDSGCGTGENSLFLAARGYEVWGLDASPRAITKARTKANERGINALFLEWNALKLDELENKFDTVIDSGLFHVFDKEDRDEYVEGLHTVLKPGGKFVFICFSELEPGDWGPKRISLEEIKETFVENDKWEINYVRFADFETRLDERPVKAYLASVTRK